MRKEYLEALNKIQHDFGQLKGQELVSCYEIIFNALKRLEAIDNSSPSEALKCLEEIYDKIRLSQYLGVVESAKLKTNYNNIKQPLQSINLLMQELDCKDMETLRKYARCGYEKLNNFKDSKEVKIEIPESSLMDYNPVKQYLKWEDLEFDKNKEIDVLMNGNKYVLELRPKDTRMEYLDEVILYNIEKYGVIALNEIEAETFNDLRLERMEE